MLEAHQIAGDTINTAALNQLVSIDKIVAVNNNNYSSSVPTVMPSRVQRAIEDFLAGIELKTARVASGITPSDDLEEDLQDMIAEAQALNPRQSAEIRQTLAAPLRTYKSDPRYRTFAGIDVDRAGELERLDLAAKHRSQVASVVTNWVHIPTVVDGLSVAADDFAPQGGYTKLNFYLSKVKCVKETRFPEFRSDEISCAASFVDETGDFTTHDPFNVSSDFDRGETKSYGFPGERLQWFNLQEAGHKFPKIYTCSLTLIERDWGSVSKWFKKFFAKLNKRLKDYLNQLGIKLGERLGLGPASSLIGTIFNKVWDFIVKFFKQLFGHDHLGTQTVQFTINGYGGNWSSTGNHTTSGWLKFTGQKSDYRVEWRAQLAQ